MRKLSCLMAMLLGLALMPALAEEKRGTYDPFSNGCVDENGYLLMPLDLTKIQTESWKVCLDDFNDRYDYRNTPNHDGLVHGDAGFFGGIPGLTISRSRVRGGDIHYRMSTFPNKAYEEQKQEDVFPDRVKHDRLRKHGLGLSTQPAGFGAAMLRIEGKPFTGPYPDTARYGTVPDDSHYFSRVLDENHNPDDRFGLAAVAVDFQSMTAKVKSMGGHPFEGSLTVHPESGSLSGEGTLQAGGETYQMLIYGQLHPEGVSLIYQSKRIIIQWFDDGIGSETVVATGALIAKIRDQDP